MTIIFTSLFKNKLVEQLPLNADPISKTKECKKCYFMTFI